MGKKTPTVLDIDLDQARTAWCRRQGLVDAAPTLATEASPSDVLANHGWARTLGGIDVYFILRARQRVATPARIDRALIEGSVQVIPAVRGCIYLVPSCDVPVVMALAAELQRPRTERDLAKVEVSFSEIEAVAEAVVEVLADGPLDTAGVRKALPKGSIRSLGDIGKKVGLSSPLPVALRELEFRGRIRRRPVTGRLDTERYDWRLVDAATDGVPGGKAELIKQVVKRVFSFFAPASIKDVAAWVGISQTDVKKAVAELPLVPIEIVGRGEAWIAESELDSVRMPAIGDSKLSFLAFEDSLLTFYGGPGIFAEDRHQSVPIGSWGRGKPTTLGAAKHPTSRSLLLGDRLVGFWEYDAAASEIVFGGFDELSSPVRKQAEKEAATLTEIIAAMGHAKSFSIDTDKALAQRVERVRQL